ncbi:hypothetical protein K474DRAFT_1602653 [Panus rudis PR-1116 ss-1]|nr:hypothetical protein K474DRAFT_1602653 [Panus rudis PR-1116 ss-1]
MKSSRITDSRKPLLGRVSYTYIDLPLELKIKCAHGAFEFKDEDDEGNPIFIRQDDLAKEDRGQVAEYISEIFERQPRQKLFTLFVHRDTVQLLVTDRTSTRISRPLNYVQHSDTLATFFFRFADTDDQGRGYDPTVVAPAGYEIEKMKETLDTLEAGYVKNLVQDAMQDGLECSVSPPSRAPMWPIRKVAVLHERKEASADGAEKDVTPLAREARHLLVGKPQFCSHDAHGRGTKGFVAYDLQEGGFVYLKESWRLDSPTVHPEWKTYERLQANGVEHVGTMLCGGDVLDPDTGSVQRTTNQRYGNGRFTARIHTRLVLKQIGRRLEDYKEAKELCRILLGGLLGHQQAWEKALILHRDISDGNILIVGENPDSVGILIDWDLCKYKEDLTPDRPVSHGQRSGTWCFMSAVRTRFPRKEALVADDIESFMNLTLWFSVRFHKHDLGNDLHDHLETYYRGTTVSDQPVPIGKFDRYMRVKKADTRVPILHPRLNMIGNWLMMLCSQHYKTFTEGDLAMWGLPGCNISELNDADNDEIPFPTYGPPPMRTLDTHNLFIDVFRSELAKPKGWDPEDKLEDQFKKLVVERDQKPVTIGSFQPSTSTHSKRSCTAEPEGEPSTSRAPKRAKRGLRGVRTGSTPLGSHQESGENV